MRRQGGSRLSVRPGIGKALPKLDAVVEAKEPVCVFVEVLGEHASAEVVGQDGIVEHRVMAQVHEAGHARLGQPRYLALPSGTAVRYAQGGQPINAPLPLNGGSAGKGESGQLQL